MPEGEPTAAEAVREAVAQALDEVRRAKAYHRTLRDREQSGTNAQTGELDEAARAVVAAEARLAAAREELLAFFAV